MTRAQKQNIKAAGILPITYDHENNKIMFLLGKERFRKNFNAGGTWCDFGGNVRWKSDILKSAACEFIEETMGMVLKTISVPDTATYVQSNLLLKFKSYAGKKVPYQMYIIFIPYDTNLIKEYQEVFDFVINSDTLRKHVKSQFLEKCQLKWMDIDEIKSCISFKSNIPNFTMRPEFLSALSTHWSAIEIVANEVISNNKKIILNNNNNNTKWQRRNMEVQS